MQALVCRQGQVVLSDLPKPSPGPDEVLIRVSMAGICNTDIEITLGYRDFQGILGHEFVGIVEKDPSGELTGKRVVGSITVYCGHCWQCRHNQTSHCLNRATIGINDRNGAFAEYITLPRSNIYCVPDSLSDAEAVLVEPLAAGMRIAEQVHIRPGDRVIVLGDGKLGLLSARILWALGHDITVVGKHADKLLAAAKLGIATSILGAFTDRVDVVVDCTGSSKGLECALDIVRPQGTIVMKTTIAGGHNLDLSPIVVNEITLVGSRCGLFAPTLELMERHDLKLEDLIEAVYPLEQGEAAFDHARRRGSRKILLSFHKDLMEG